MQKLGRSYNKSVPSGVPTGPSCCILRGSIPSASSASVWSNRKRSSRRCFSCKGSQQWIKGATDLPRDRQVGRTAGTFFMQKSGRSCNKSVASQICCCVLRAIYPWRLPHQLGRAGKGRADGVSIERDTSGITLYKTATSGVAGLYHFHGQRKIGTDNFAGRSFAPKS